MDINSKYPKGRKSLAIDVDTYDMLQSICNSERRTKIDQLKLLIEREYQKINEEGKKVSPKKKNNKSVVIRVFEFISF